MLTKDPPRARRGVTLIELLVVMVVGSLALGLVASISLRQQRAYADLADASALSGQLRDAAAILPIDLRGAASTAGDIREARDTSIELRGTIASAVVCDTVAGSLVLAPSVTGVGTFASYLSSIDAGDTAWVYTTNDSTDEWRPFRVSASSSAAAGQCAASAPLLSSAARSIARIVVALDAPPLFTTVIGMPLRVTRPLRFSLYRSSDGAWYVGEKDWSTASQRFNTIQPVSGPFLSAASGGLTLRYFDSTGSTLTTPVADTRAIAAIRVELRGQTRNAVRILSAASAPGTRGDSVSVMVLVHNRR